MPFRIRASRSPVYDAKLEEVNLLELDSQGYQALSDFRFNEHSRVRHTGILKHVLVARASVSIHLGSRDRESTNALLDVKAVDKDLYSWVFFVTHPDLQWWKTGKVWMGPNFPNPLRLQTEKYALHVEAGTVIGVLAPVLTHHDAFSFVFER